MKGFETILIKPDISNILIQTFCFDCTRNNAISNLPSEWTTFSKLREINLSYNRLKEVPAVVFTWTQLENLILGDNQIGIIDVPSLKKLPKIASLDLQNNDIMQVPPELGNLETLR